MDLENKEQKPQTNHELKALILYWSATGNTEKVAFAIQKGLEKEKVKPILKKVTEAADEDLCTYDLIFAGSPAYMFHPPEPVYRFLREKHKFHVKRGDVKLGSPIIPGRTAVMFCTYSGPHTGINEAIPVTKYMGQIFEHVGFEIAGEWHIIGEFHNREEHSTKGKLGDTRGRPNEQDLAKVEDDTSKLVRSILAARG